jgi:hypothetical protein
MHYFSGEKRKLPAFEDTEKHAMRELLEELAG